MRFIEAGRDFLKNNKVIRDNQRCPQWRNQSRDWVIYFFISDDLLCSKMFWYLLHNTIYYIYMYVYYFCRHRVALKIIHIPYTEEAQWWVTRTHTHKPSWLPLSYIVYGHFDDHKTNSLWISTSLEKKSLWFIFIARVGAPEGWGRRQESGCHSNMSYM